MLSKIYSVLVPGGFGVRGSAGMIKATTWARTQKVPFLGICFGMQLAVIEYAQNVAGIKDAASEELDEKRKSPNHIIIYMPEVRSSSICSHITNTNSRSTRVKWAEQCVLVNIPASSKKEHLGLVSEHYMVLLRQSPSAIDIGSKSIRCS